MTKDDHRRSNFKAKMIFERKGMPAPVVALKNHRSGVKLGSVAGGDSRVGGLRVRLTARWCVGVSCADGFFWGFGLARRGG